MTHRSSPAAIAVIGMACRYPDATDPRELWETLLARRRQFRRFPDCRLPLADYYDADKKAPDKTYGRQAAVIDGFDFDWAHRRIPFSTVQTTDIVHWLALETSLAAVADAGYTKEALPGERTGVIVGNTLTGEQTRASTMRLRWPFIRRALYAAARFQGMADDQIETLSRILKDRYTAVFPAVDEDTLAGGLSNTIAGRICNHLNLMGGGFTVDGACASSLLAVAHAAARIVDGDLDLAIVGGVDISLDPFELIGFAKTGALTDGDMTVYDREGKGFIPGEGCGFLVLKALDAARRDGDVVYAVLHGWGISSDGGGSGITAPSVSGQALALQRAYRHAPYGFTDLDFIEGHGTGTTVGDRTELEAIAQAQGRTPVDRGQLRPCGITSLKSVMGHTKAASGIGGLIKAVMAVNRRVVPPTAACRHPHQAFDSAARRLYPVRLGRREPTDRQLIAGVSSMGFGGINCHLTLRSGDAPDPRLEPVLDETALMAHAQEDELLIIGAEDLPAMQKAIAGLIEKADGISIAELADLAADLSRELPSDPRIRAAVVAGHPDELADRLTRLAASVEALGTPSRDRPIIASGSDTWLGIGDTPPRIGFLFPGQGSQQINMARMLAQRFPWARSLVDQADRITQELTGIPVSRLVYRDTDRAPGPEDTDRWFQALSRTEHAQPAICLANAIWFEFFSRLGIRPDAVGGHSLGELNACHAGGRLDTDTLIGFAARRGLAMANGSEVSGAMVGLRCDESAARDLLSQVNGYITVANLNSLRQTVLSGESEAADAVLRVAREHGIGARRLSVSGAFHSRLCDDAARQVGQMTFPVPETKAPGCRIFSSIDGNALDAARSLSDHFSKQVRSPVNFIHLVENMADCCDVLIEVGPGRVLGGLAEDILGPGETPCLPVESRATASTDMNRVLGELFIRGVRINWEVVYANRLIRPFVPAASKSFVVNPCETLPRGDQPDAAEVDLPAMDLPSFLTDAFTGVPEALVSRYLENRGAFLNQVVRADYTHWNPEATGGDAGMQAITTVPEGARSLLFQLVTEVTGFDPQTLSGAARLLDDLNLDSIKAGDLVARFATRCGIAFPDPALLANASLDELADAADRLMAAMGRSGPAASVDRIRLTHRLKSMVSEIAGFPEASLEPSMRLLDDLNLDSIKAGDLVARLAEEAGAAGRMDVPSLANATLDQVAGAIASCLESEVVKATGPDALTVLLAQAAGLTGFSDDILDPDLLVESELHLGPDKLASLLKKTTTVLGIQAHLDINPLLSRSLRQIGVILDRMIVEQRGPAAVQTVESDDRHGWVRNFSMALEPTSYPRFPDSWGQRSEDDWQQARVLIVHSRNTVDVAEKLEQHLFQRGAATHLSDVEEDGVELLARDASFSHLVAILPKPEYRDGDRAALLRRMIRMRATVTAPPLAAEAPRRRTTVAWVQFGGGFFGRDPRFAKLDCCAGLALGASLHLERTDLRVRVVDFCPTLSAEIIAWETIAELTTPDSFTAVGYDLDRTRRTLFPRLDQPSAYAPSRIAWSSEDVILATGGAGGITAVCAFAVARETGVRMALVGRTPHPDQAPESKASRKIRTLLDDYAALGLTAHYFPCDVTDREAVTRMLATVEGGLGPVTGIIHGAGLNRPRQTGQVDVEQAFEETAPKVLGLLHLLDALTDKPPKMVLGMGSVIGITGMPGNGWYGFSNEVMDIALRGFAVDHPGTRTLDVAYSIWRDQGMGARMGSVDILRKKGIDAIPTQEGVDRLVKLFTHDPGSHQIVVTARMGGLDTWNEALPEDPQNRRFLQERVRFTPGVEAVFAAHLTLESDPYLRDHHFQGSYLFPTVFGLEAMTQAAMALTGNVKLSSLKIRDVHLSRPITVDPGTGADILIRAILDESGAGDDTVVRAGIQKSGAGISSDFFSATLIFGAAMDPGADSIHLPEMPLPLIPSTDLYRPSLLFQGDRFQNIETVWKIAKTETMVGTALFSSRVTPTQQATTAAFGVGNTTCLCLRDPFFTDTLLQSAALLVPQDTSLPVTIERMDLFAPYFQASSPATVKVTLMGQEDRDLIYQVTAVGDDGEVMALLSGYRLRILKHHDDYPTVADLVSPKARDRRLVVEALEDACRHFSLTSPTVNLDCIPGIHDMPKPARHEAEGPLLEKTLAEAVRRYDFAMDTPVVQWRTNGKPVIADVAPDVMDLSVTHEDRMCLCVCGPGPQGCDLSTINTRTREAWNGLLGDGRHILLDELVDQGESLETAGTRVWAAVETLAKAGLSADAHLRLEGRADNAVLFKADTENDTPLQILTLIVHLTWGAPKILALTVAGQHVPRVPEHLLTADYPGYEPLYETRPFEMIEGGPQGQLMFVQRLPVTFQPSANLSRTIYFANFIKWMGNTREASAWPVLAQMSDQFASGRWGGVTNYGHLKILGEGRTSDRIEILMWVSDNSGPENSTMTLSYDFRKMLPDGGFERLAFCRLQTTWVEILGPGVARVAPYPAYYGQFIEDMCPRVDAPDKPEPLPESLGHLFADDGDPVVYQAPSGPTVRPVVREQAFETTLAHANLVGNIYYANYYDWQGQIRDRFFYELIPDYYRGIGEKGELLTLESRVDHLREAMPFDRLMLTLAVKELRRCSVTFHVDYFRLEAEGDRVKIAHGLHRAVWTQRDGQGRPMAAPFPDAVKAAFDAAISAIG